VTGYGFTLMFSLLGVVAGWLADRHSRLWLLFGGALCWNSATFLASQTSNFTEFLVCRVFLGVQAIGNPVSLGLIAEYFPPNTRLKATVIYSTGIYLASGISTFISATSFGQYLGWRTVFIGFGLAGLSIAFMLVCTVRDPRRSLPKNLGLRYMRVQNSSSSVVEVALPFREGLKYLAAMRSFALLCLAGGMRSLGGYAFGAYVFDILSQRYAAGHESFGWIWASITMSAGLLASLIAVSVTQRYKNPEVSCCLCACGSMLALPCLFGMLFIGTFSGEVGSTESYILTLLCGFAALLAGELWPGPSASLVQLLVPRRLLSFAIGVYFFCLTMLGGAGPEVVALFPRMDGNINPVALFATLTGSYTSATALWLLASHRLQDDVLLRAQFEVNPELPPLSVASKTCLCVVATMCVVIPGLLLANSFR
jgi:MFS family permease